jgi:tetratricopeptide (TPR) repeat protein
MPLIATLLERAQLQAGGIYVDRPWQWLEQSDQPPLEKGWYAWVQAHVALLRDERALASAWLQVADNLLADHPDELCGAEVLASWSLFFDRTDEPREAARYAYAAWQKWFAFASDPQTARDPDSIRVLVRVLASPDEPPSLGDDELYWEWLADRFGLQFWNSARAFIGYCGRLGLVEPALEVAEKMRGWFDLYLHRGSLPADLTVVPYAELLGDVANLYDQVGDKAHSLEKFREALDLLDNAADHPSVRVLRARLRFNVGNQLAKLGSHEEAARIYQAAQTDFTNLGQTEAAFRAKHAGIVSRWKMQQLEGLREDLEGVLEDYEGYYEQSQSAGERAIVRQNLDAAYRLWLTLAAAKARNDERLTQRFLQQLYALREGFVDFARKWSRVAELDANTNVVTEIGVLDSRLARLHGTVLLVMENGVDRVVLTTLRPGVSSLTDRVRTELASEAFNHVLGSLLELHQEAVNMLIDRAISVKSPAGEDFERACRDVWRELPDGIRRDLAEAKTVLVSPSNFGNMDEIPVELFHDGEDYLGLAKNVMRVTSLSQLLGTLGDNRVNVQPYNEGLIVRAADITELGQLPHADAEVRWVEKSMQALTNHASVLREPSRADLLEVLGDGIDVMHYVGHGFADEGGEIIILGDEEDLSALDIRSTGPAPAPVCVMSSCLVGRARHLRTGEQQGIAVALLAKGAQAVVAASYALPDQVGSQFALALYHHGRERGLSDAVRLTRQSLAGTGFHPAAWSGFVLLGHPDAVLGRTPKNSDTNLAWPTSLCRFIATGAPAYLDVTRRQLHADSRLSAEQIESVDAALTAFSEQDRSFFAQDRVEQSVGIEAFDLEAYLAHRILLALGYLRYGTASGDGDTEERKRGLLGSLLTTQRLLDDSYVLVAVVLEATKLSTYFVGNEEQRRLLRSGLRALDWLNADDALLEEAREAFSYWEETLEKSMVFNIQEIAGVDAETLEAADTGDRQAQKRMLRNLWIRQASAEAITSSISWTEWMLRMIGCGSFQAISDLLGVIEESRKNGLLSETKAAALNRLLEQYAGPDEVDEATANNALDAFSGESREHEVLDLFMTYDHLSSGEREVPISEVQRAMRIAEELNAPGAKTYFTGVWCQKAAQLGAVEPAVNALWEVLRQLEELATQDSEYADRIGITALLLRQLCQFLNDTHAVARIDARYMNAMQAHLSQ